MAYSETIKDILIIWLMWQLFTLGISAVEVHNKIFNKTLDCTKAEISMVYGVITPLIAFVDLSEVTNYCSKQN